MPEEEVNPIAVSINSIVGFTNPKTLKLVGKIGEGEVVVMVDPGALIISFPSWQLRNYKFQ